ncbi:AB hydrolase-1 domain-containing protein [Favolaschia claudopus]|uniref:AB hydrolase-1 domain-containing protein n=1 Tax=Favolaschia claudopus TaxID=2862362 RepID=A0AAW0DR54_9AGAR
MPSLALESGVVFAYTDSGALTDYTCYKTVVIIHGHTFHNGTFQRLNALAKPNGLRIISVNRREYPGSTPYSDEELATFACGSDAERAVLLEQQGRDLAMFLDGLITHLHLPQTGGMAILGWSMGCLFLMALVSCICTLPKATQERLSSFVHNIVMLQPPSLAFGIPTPPGWLIPQTDPRIAPEARGPAFAKWVSSYFIHGNLSSRNIDELTYDDTDPDKSSTIETLTPEEFLGMTDFAPGDRYDNIVGLPPFAAPVFEQTQKALFNEAVRDAWRGTQFWNVYGDAEPWNIIYAAWFLEDLAIKSAFQINFKVIHGINHFLVWENPEKALNELKECI